MHGSAPHAYVLCHMAGETIVDGDDRFTIPPLAEVVALHEQISLLARPARVHAVALNTRQLDDAAARRAIDMAEAETGLPADDPVRFGACEARRCSRSSVREVGPSRRGNRTLGPCPGPSLVGRLHVQLRREKRACVRKLLAAVAMLGALVAVGGASAEPLRYGVADDWPKFHPCGDIWWTSASDIGYQDLRMTVQWDVDAPTVIPFQSSLQMAIDCARLNNIRPILAIYPAKPSAIGSDDDAQNAFASFVALVGQAFPDVQNFIVGNEPNLNRFWQPQYVNGHDAAAIDYEHTLAKSYDALKLVRPDSIVWGPAISSRGNDNPNAASNPSHSPVWFIKDMGDAYRASGRWQKLFDEFDLHPYPPVQDTDPFSKPFRWPQAGAANLDRIKQALWDAFHGTGQPTVTEGAFVRTAPFAAPQALPIDLDEVGDQTIVPADKAAAYDGTAENVTAISEAQQARNHVELAELAACDPAVRSLLYFPLIDDTGNSTRVSVGQPLRRLRPEAVVRGDEGQDRIGAGPLPGRRAGHLAAVVAYAGRCSVQPAASAAPVRAPARSRPVDRHLPGSGHSASPRVRTPPTRRPCNG